MRTWAVALLITLGLCGTAEAGVAEWPVIGQAIRVGSCIVGGTGTLVGSLASKLSAWGSELFHHIGQCALTTTTEVTDVAEDVVTISVPTPDPIPAAEPTE